MKNQIGALFIGLTFTLASVSSSHAMSELVSMSKDPVWPASSTPDGNIVYNVTTVGRSGSGLLEVVLTADGMPPGVTVTFNPTSLRFTGNKLTAQTATMTVHCPSLIAIDCFPFTITGTARHEAITITNEVYFTPQFVAVRPPTLMLDRLTNGVLHLRGLGATGKIYQIQASPSLSEQVWTTIGTSTADGNGRFTFFTSQTSLPGDLPVRFFRAVTTPEPVVNP
jgi:hypothetical protein